MNSSNRRTRNTPRLNEGMANRAIQKWQDDLKAVLPAKVTEGLIADGKWGPFTTKVTKAFYGFAGIRANGKQLTATGWAAMVAALANLPAEAVVAGAPQEAAA
jgi:hypothetical protein